VAKIEIARKEDLNGLATVEQVNLKADKNHTHSWSEITDKPSIPDTSGLATKTELEQVVGTVNLKSDVGHTHSWSEITDKPSIPDTSDLATKEELGTKADIEHKHSYNDLDDKPSIPSISGLASQADLDALSGTVADLQDLVSTLQAEIEALKGGETGTEE